MSFSVSISPDANDATRAPTVPAVTPGLLEQLQREREASDSAERRATLLHEEAVVKGLLGDVHSAVLAHVEASELVGNFFEPLMVALGICEERAPDRISELLADFDGLSLPTETRTHLLQYSALVALSRDELRVSEDALNRAIADDATEPTTWLLFELLAARNGDDQLRERALSMQAEQATDATWKGMIQLDAAQASEKAGALESALAWLQAAADSHSEVAWPALLALERFGTQHGNLTIKNEALKRQAAALLASLPQTDQELASEAETQARNSCVYLLLKAALSERAAGDPNTVQQYFERAVELAPLHRGVRALALAEAGRLGDHQASQRHARALLEAGVSAPEQAALWLHIAAAALAEKELDAALSATKSALECDAGCLLATALQLELHSRKEDPVALAAFHTRNAERATTPAERGRALYTAAELRARGGNIQEAAALVEAAAGEVALTARIQRFLAATVQNNPWFVSLTEKLNACLPSEDPSGVGFEVLRRNALAGPVALAEAEPEDAAPDTALRAWLVAYGPKARENSIEQQAKALTLIAGLETDPDRRHSCMLAAALRANLAGNPKLAILALTQAEDSGYREPVASLMLAQLSQKAGAWQDAASSLHQLALGSHDLNQAAALLLQSGLCSWHGGDRHLAIEAFESAHEIAPDPSLPILRFARRLVEPDEVRARRTALETPALGEAQALSLLERFTLEALLPEGRTHANSALEQLEMAAPQELHSTAALTRALWSNATEASLGKKLEAFERLEDWGEQATSIARAAAYYAREVRDPMSATDALEAAEAWVQSDPTVLPALEWLLAARQAEDFPTEALAQHTLGARLHGTARSAFETSAALMNLLLDQTARPQLSGSDSASRYAALELAPPGSDPRRRASALGHATELFGEENQSLVTALAGYNLLALGELASAEQAFKVAATQSPEDVFVWEGLRSVAELSKNRGLLAEAYAGLGDSVADATQGALYWEKTSLILLDELGELELGEHALTRAITRDISRTRCFDRLFRIVRERKDHPRLLALIEARLDATDDVDELSKLFWERARAFRTLKQLPLALAALESVQMLEPDHVGALALAGEIFMSQGDFGRAAENLAKLSALPNAPAQQRLMSGVAAVDIYENKLQDTLQALAVLAQLYRSGQSTLPVRERLARAATSAGAWGEALDVLEDLSKERDTSERRAEAARLCMVISRDKLSATERAERAALRLLAEEPADPEALDLVLSRSNPDREQTKALVSRSLGPLVDWVLNDPLDAKRLKLLFRLANALEDAPLSQVTVGALAALGESGPELDAALLELSAQGAITPRLAMDADSVPDLLDPEDNGALAELMREAAPAFAEILGPTLQSFGINKKQRVDPRLGLPIRNEIAAWAGALGLGEFDLYIGGEEPDAVRGLVDDTPALLIGTAVVSPLSPAHRQAVARELFALRQGTSILRAREPAEVAALIAATGQVLGVNLEGPSYAMTAEFVRLLGRGLGRKTKKMLPLWVERVRTESRDPLMWIAGALSSMDRVAALASGDVSWVIAKEPSARRKRLTSPEDRSRLLRLLTFVLSPRYLELRKELGLEAR
mgnify:CR=1 FL=1